MDKSSVAEVTDKAVLEIVRQKSGERNTVHPYNFHSPDYTAWWVIPSTEWPAYQHGKFFSNPVWGRGFRQDYKSKKAFHRTRNTGQFVNDFLQSGSGTSLSPLHQ